MKALSDKERARLQFVTWMQEAHPDLLKRALDYAEKWRKGQAAGQGQPWALSGLGANGEPQSFWEKLSEGITSLATGVLAYKTQKTVLDANIERAREGLPPIDMASGAPVVRTQIDVSPEIAARLQESAAAGMRNVLLYGGLALGAVFLFMRR